MPMLLIFIINAICTLPSCVIPLILVCKTAQMKDPKRYAIVFISTQYLLWAVNNYILPNPSTLLELIMHLILFITTCYYAVPEQRVTATLSIIVYMSAMFLTTLALAYAMEPVFIRFDIPLDSVADAHGLVNAGMCLVAICFTGPAMYLCHLILVKLLRHHTLSRWLLLFLPVPLSQGILINIIIRLTPYSYQIMGVQITMILGILFCMIADICFFIGIEKISKSNLLETQIQMAAEQLDTQASYYRQLQDSILSVNQIRHDLSNQLQAAYYLLEKGENTQVRKQLDILMENVQERIGPRYSENLMVDAVLLDKARLCLEKGIHLQISVEIPAEIPIENAHLCSAFSNLLDNSIRGVLESGTKDPYIDLRAVIHAGCLTIQCINPAGAEQRKSSNDPLRSHGLGLEILERLAKQYSGILEIRTPEGLFDATLILRFVH